MKNIAVISAIDLRPPAARPVMNGLSSFQRALEFARGLPGVTQTVLLASASRPLPPDTPRGFRVIERESWTVADLTAEIEKAAEGFEDIFYFFADCPFLDLSITERMHRNHRRYWADYTFADGFPQGLTPEILTRETASRLRGMASAEAGLPDRETLFTVIRKDINSFDIETELAPATCGSCACGFPRTRSAISCS